MNLSSLKGLLILTIVVISLLGGAGPVFFREKIDPAMPFLSIFAAGVFLSLSFMHLLPEATELLSLYYEDHGESRVNPVFLAVMFAFVLLLSVEQLAEHYIERMSGRPEAKQPLLGNEITEQGPDSGSDNLNGRAHDHHHHHDHQVLILSKPGYQGFLLLSALSLHAFFEALSLGAQPDQRTALLLFGGIAIHKALEEFALSSSLIRQKNISNGKIVTILFLFAMITPIGAGIGMGAQRLLEGDKSKLATAIINGFASGTFLFVATTEVIPTELADGKHRTAKMMCLIAGFGAALAALSAFPDHDHDH